MKKLVMVMGLIISTCLLFVAVSAAKEPMPSKVEMPNLIGTWGGTNHAVIAGKTNHQTGRPNEVLFKDHDTVSIVIDRQEGRRFSGQMRSIHDAETLTGFIDPDGKTLWMADEDGYIVGKLLDDGSLWYRYLESTSESVITSYAHFTRSRTGAN